MVQDDFQQAVADSKTLAKKPGNDILLKLYSLYKQATEGDADDDGPTNAFDFVGKAKYEAWDAVRGKTKEAAMEEYIQLVKELKG
jgi:diazepam-binding inhibitor (GABA receptor modulating acyl-CoA-binding protein)